MAHALPRAGISRRSWPVPHDAFCDRGGAALSQEKTAVASARNRDLHLGRLAGKSEDRRYRRLCLPRARMGARPVELSLALSPAQRRVKRYAADPESSQSAELVKVPD